MNRRFAQLALALAASQFLMAAPAYAAATIAGTALGNNSCAVAQAEVTLRIEWNGSVSGKPAGHLDQTTSTGPRGGFRFSVNEERLDPDNLELVRLSARSHGFATDPVSIPPRRFNINGSNAVTLRFPRLPGINHPDTGQPTTTGNCAPAPTQPRRPVGGAAAGTGGVGPVQSPNQPAVNPSASSGGKTIGQITPPSEITTLADRLNPRKPEGEAIGRIWRTMLNITNGIVILVFLVMGFATIFSVQIDTYGVKKALPNVIIAIILANFSLFITRMVVDVANIGVVAIVNNQGGSEVLVNNLLKTFIHGGRDKLGELIGIFSTNQGGGVYESAIKSVVFVSAIYVAGGYLVLGAVLLAALAIIVPSIFILILAVLFYVRTYVILALAAVSPLAFIAFALPAGQVLFRQWWTQLARWAFMGPIAFFMIWLGIQFTEAFGGGFEFGIYLISLTMLYLAISLPFKMGGVITGNVAKYLGKPLRQAGGFGARWYGRTSDVVSGKISKGISGRPITLGGLYRGWGANADRYYQRHVAESSGAGEDVREMVASGAMGILRPREFGGRVKRGINIMLTGERHKQAVNKQIASEAQQIAALSDDAVTSGLAEAIQDKDHSKAAPYLIAKAMQGQDVTKDFEEIAGNKKLLQDATVQQALSSAQKEAMKNSNFVVNPAHGGDAERNAGALWKRLQGNKTTGQLETAANQLLNQFERDSNGDIATNAHNELRARALRDMVSQAVVDKNPAIKQALDQFAVTAQVQGVEVSEQAKDEFSAQIADLGVGSINIDGVESQINLRGTPAQAALNPRQLGALRAFEVSGLQHRDQGMKQYATEMVNKFRGQLDIHKNAPTVNRVIEHLATGSYGTGVPGNDADRAVAHTINTQPFIMDHFRFETSRAEAAIRQAIGTTHFGSIIEDEIKKAGENINIDLMPKIKVRLQQSNVSQNIDQELHRLLDAKTKLSRGTTLSNRFREPDKQARSFLNRFRRQS
ncbi:MAG: hypothetical protein WAP74_02825 [Patescibacteria group bacterium]